ncbi:MAG: DUF1656 domain-containing protein [Candidatus Eremiobacteraeota bacterium]|nr:DUF1656 domain-containing protein [Candidatus Eremiobacteraeota bacterium]
MIHDFPELVIGDVLIAPFVIYAAAALILLLLLRPALRLARFESLFSNPPVALLCVYVTILTLLMVLV